LSTANTKGKEAEAQALAYLEQQGLKRVERNFSARRGEIDLIMGDGGTLVFIEVRYRKGSTFGSAIESVNRSKQQRLLLAAQYYLQSHPQYAASPCRFDVIGISGEQGRIEWIKDAFGL
jgi:putative endonuclease